MSEEVNNVVIVQFGTWHVSYFERVARITTEVGNIIVEIKVEGKTLMNHRMCSRVHSLCGDSVLHRDSSVKLSTWSV